MWGLTMVSGLMPCMVKGTSSIVCVVSHLPFCPWQGSAHLSPQHEQIRLTQVPQAGP